MKVRTIPRGYVQVDELSGFVRECGDRTPAEWFMRLYGKFGNPQDGGIWSYLLRHNNIVLRITAINRDDMDYSVWVAPSFVRDAKRKRVKVMNVIARRLNDNDVVFLPDEGEKELYYVIRRKNAALMSKKAMSAEAVREAMDAFMTDDERNALYGSLTQYMDDVKKEIAGIVGEVFDE